MKDAVLDKRLGAVAELTRQGAILADIGTDHAYLPVFLLKTGKISYAYATDINSGPLASAKETVLENGLSDRVALKLTDGADGLSGLGITDYAICGMGGELIAEIVSRAEDMRDKSVRLILQPMSRQAHLRRTLAALGFEIITESYSFADGKYYVCFLAEYTGKKKELSLIDAELGNCTDVRGRVEYIGYLRGKLAALIRARDGKIAGGIDTREEDALILAYKTQIEKEEKA